MTLPGNIVERRARFMVRILLVLDLLLAAMFYLRGAPPVFLVATALHLLLLLPYWRYVRRAPASLTIGLLAFWATLLASLPYGLGSMAGGAWVLFPLVPMGAGFVLGRRNLLWLTAGVTTAIAALATLPLVSQRSSLTLDQDGLIVLAASLILTIWTSAWLIARTLRPEARSPEILGEPLTVVRNVMVVPFDYVVGGIPAEKLRSELQELKQRHHPRWIVLDLAPAGDLGRHDLMAIEQAAEDVITSRCAVVLARPPVDAVSHLDVAKPVIGRMERFATIPQAVEAGLRRQGWMREGEKPPGPEDG